MLHVIEAPHRVNAEAESLAAVMAARAHAAQQLAEVREDLVRCGLSVKVRLVLGNPAEHIGVTAKDEGRNSLCWVCRANQYALWADRRHDGTGCEGSALSCSRGPRVA